VTPFPKLFKSRTTPPLLWMTVETDETSWRRLAYLLVSADRGGEMGDLLVMLDYGMRYRIIRIRA
jgi:hypothetical protein